MDTSTDQSSEEPTQESQKEGSTTSSETMPGFDPLIEEQPNENRLRKTWEPGGEHYNMHKWDSMPIPEIVARRVHAMQRRGVWFRLERDVGEDLLRNKHKGPGAWALANGVELRRGSIYLDNDGNEVEGPTDHKRWRLYACWWGDLPLSERYGPDE